MAVSEAPAALRPGADRPAPRREGAGPQRNAPRRPPRAARGARGDLALTIGAAVATLAAMLPIARLILPTWFGGAILTVALMLLAGYALRRAGVPALLATAGELLVWVLCATIALGHEDSLLGVLPTFGVLGDLPRVVDVVAAEVAEGVAPMEPSGEFAFVLIAAGGLLAFVVGLLVREARLPLVAAVVLISVFVVPQLAVPGDPDLVSAVILMAAILWLVRAEIRSRRPGMEAGRVASTWAAVLGIGSVVAAVVLAPGVPLPDPAGGGVGRTTTISASLDLGDDLRRPADVEVLRLRTDGSPPYLRVATLTQFDGDTWSPDGTPRGTLDFDPIGGGIPVIERTTTVEITRLTGEYLPVPYPATEVTGLVGRWTANDLNRTVTSDTTSALGQRYVVVSQEPQTTREQARDVMPRVEGGLQDFLSHPGDGREYAFNALALPDVGPAAAIRAQTREVIGDATNAYDALIAMQSWFRSSGGFTYSLDAPVEEGFDGSGMDAIQRFLEVRSGYCTHFASTFAVMARSIGIPARVVVGYLPGTATGDEVDDQDVYTVLGSQLHAWPETYLDGIGWVPFDPTVGLGSPTSLRSEVAPGAAPTTGPDASQAPTPVPTASRDLERDTGDASAPTGAVFNPAGLLRGLAIAAGALLVLAVPAVMRAARWRVRLAAARRGEAGAAWRELQDLVIDGGLAVDESESPRVFAAHLTRDYGVPSAALSPLVAAIERASFAPGAGAGTSGSAGPDLARALAQARRALLPAGRERLRASLLPRSLVVRPRVTEL